MDKIKFSKTDSRRTVMALAVVAMFLATVSMTYNADANTNNVSLEADCDTTNDDECDLTIMVGQEIDITLTVDNDDTRYRKMDVYMEAVWTSEIEWETKFMKANYDGLSGGKVTMVNGESTVILRITCSGVCVEGSENLLRVYGLTDPKFYGGSSSRTETNEETGVSYCGSDDCENESTPASSSTNKTNIIDIYLTAATEHSSTIDCETVSENGDNSVYQDEIARFDYTLTNTGYSSDSYLFTVTADNSDGADTSDWLITAGLQNGKNLDGSSGSGDKVAESVISVTPSSNARPGVYTIEMVVTSNGGGADVGCNFPVVVPEPDLEIKNTDISFSHTSAWINTNDKSQVIQIYVKVRNNGGTIDSTGAKTKNIEVKFYIDGAQLGGVETIESLGHGEEVPISREWQPARAYDEDNEVGLSVVVKVDPSDEIDESDNDNNQGTQYFKVIRSKSSTPSFLMGFFALISAVAVAVMLSSYYRNRDLE